MEIEANHAHRDPGRPIVRHVSQSDPGSNPVRGLAGKADGSANRGREGIRVDVEGD